MPIRHYILDDDGEPQPVIVYDAHGHMDEQALISWAKWFETANRAVLRTAYGAVEVSTVFLSLNHNYYGEGPPILWETMVFGGALDGEQDRYTSKLDALAGHQAMCERVMAAMEGE